MSLNGLLNQEITIYGKTGHNRYGREVVGVGSTTNSRFQATTKRILTSTGEMMTIDAICYAPADTVVEPDDRVDYDGQKYKVFGRYKTIDGTGNIHHIRLELIKWRET